VLQVPLEQPELQALQALQAQQVLQE